MICTKCQQEVEGAEMFGVCATCEPPRQQQPKTKLVLVQDIMPGVLDILETDVSAFWGDGNKANITRDIAYAEKTAVSVFDAAANPGKKPRKKRPS